MIVYTEEKFPYSVNIGRPEFTNDREMDQWVDVHNWIKESDVEMKINGAYHFITEQLADRQGYLGGGMEYRFWFKTDRDMAAFKNKVGTVFHRRVIKE